MDEFSFPFEPYSSQLSLMQAITKCIEGKKIGILESPTGTGKSLSIICATLTWLQRHEEEQKKQLNEQLDALEQAGKDEDDWVQAHLKKFHAINDAKTVYERIENNRKVEERVKRAMEESSSNVRKRKYVEEGDKYEQKENYEVDDALLLDDFKSDDDDNSDQSLKKSDDETTPNCTKIIYATRTHSQLQQFANEVMKTKFRPRMVTIGSRQQYCLNDSVRNLRNPGLMTERCNELRDNETSTKQKVDSENDCEVESCKQKCPFARNDAIEDICNQILATKLSDASRVVDYGKKINGCPYFGTRKSVAYSQLVMLPYQILLQEEARKAWGIDLRDNVVIIDEAHNLLEIITNCYSVTLYASDLQNSCNIVSLYLERYSSRLKQVHLKYLRQMKTLMEHLQSYIIHETAIKKFDHVEKVTTFVAKSYIGQYKLYNLLDYIEQTHLIAKLHKFSRHLKKEDNKPREKLTGVERLLKKRDIQTPASSKDENISSLEEKEAALSFNSFKLFLKLMTLKYDENRIILECPSEKETPSIRYFLINPASQLSDLIKQCRSLILIGGTMEPSDQLIKSLAYNCKVQQTDIIRRSFGHIISEKQLLAITVGRAADVDLMFTYEKRENVKMMNALLETLKKIARAIPNGMIVFFPSYGYLESFIRKVPINTLREIKPTFLEYRNSPPGLFDGFAKLARKERGALLFAVVGGKLSEGINFSDELGRAVVIIGLPFSYKEDVAIKEKLRYLDCEYGSGAGASYYESKCMHAINQSVGRVIRHRYDHAAIIMLDKRYQNSKVIQGLSSWIRPNVRNVTSLDDGIKLITSFFDDKKKIVRK